MTIGRALLTLLFMRCDQVAALESARQERDLSKVEDLGTTLHYAACTACRRYRRQLQLIRKAFRKLREEERLSLGSALPPDVKARIRDALNRD